MGLLTTVPEVALCVGDAGSEIGNTLVIQSVTSLMKNRSVMY